MPMENRTLSLSSLSPAFRIWITSARKDDFEIAIEALIKSGKAKDEKEAAAYLDLILAKVPLSEPKYFTSYDFWQPNKQRDAFRKIKEIVNEITKKEEDKFLWRYGTVGHTLIPKILAGELTEKSFSYPSKINPMQSSFTGITASKQLELFNRLLPPENLKAPESGRSLLRTLKKDWHTLALELEKAGQVADLLLLRRNEIQKFSWKMERILGDYVLKIKRGNETENVYLFFLTLMSWASALVHCRKKRIFFKEIPVMDKGQNLPGGRIDALEVRLINKKPPSYRQLRQLRIMSKQKFSSVGHLLFSLHERFGEIICVIIDWKFAVGDNTSGKQIINPSDIKDAPLKMHSLQMHRYLTMASLDYHLICKKRGLQNHWPKDNQFIKGEITYFMPTIPPFTHELILNPEEQDIFFTNEVALNWTLAQRRAILRYCNRQIADNLLTILEKEIKKHSSIANQIIKNNQMNFWPKEKEFLKENSARRMIEERRLFADQYQIVEKVGKDMKYELHFDRLLNAIREGVVPATNFSLPRGGFVRCFLPDHKNENTPSFHISLSQGIFKCFGCGIGGTIIPNSLPSDINVSIPSSYWSRRAYNATINAVMPDEKHISIMAHAQNFLQKSFKGSPAETYLVNERKLNHQLAFQLGAGFGSDALINGLINSGFTLPDLVFYGFISPLAHISVLKDRVTFPLVGVNGQINNFYGRIIKLNANRTLFHRKLSVTNTGIPHGTFNLNVLNSEVPEIIIVEGVMDALTLIEMGHTNTVAIIGTDNKIAMEAIAKSEKKIAIALDNDDGGKRITPKLIENFLKRGKSMADIRDFTADFVLSHPEMTHGMDWNSWKKEQKNV